MNVGAALARLAGERTLFIDLHMSYGDAAVFLGAEPRFSVVDAIENTHRLDAAFFESLVVETKSRVHLLASADRATHGGADLGRVGTLLHFAAAHYRYTFLDVPRSEAAALDALESVAKIIIVANQELATVRNAGRMATALRQRYGKDRIRVVLTRYDKQAEIGQEDVERVIGLAVKHVVPSDYRAGAAGAEQGSPVGARHRQSALRRVHLDRVRSERRAAGICRDAAKGSASLAESREGDDSDLGLMNTEMTTNARPPGRQYAQPRHIRTGNGGRRHAKCPLPGAEGAVHQELLNRLNLERLTQGRRRDAEPEIRELINSDDRGRGRRHASESLRAGEPHH